MSEEVVSVRRIPDSEELVPLLAWPTLILLAVSLGAWLASTALALAGALPLAAAIAINSVAAYLLFTVHDDGRDPDHYERDRLRTTRNRIGAERLVSPVLLYQNYHLVHHLHPVVPFYRYIAVWRRNEDAYLAGDPALSTVRGRDLTVEEYRSLRELRGAQ